MPRRLDPEEAALWAKVTSTVRPIGRRATPPPPAPSMQPSSLSLAAKGKPAPPLPRMVRPSVGIPANTLDGGWDRRIASGRITPDITVDLHGYNLVSAHAVLERRLNEALTQGARVILVITGRPPKAVQDNDRPRGLIRQQLPHWLASSPNRGAIAAVRGAHPRHGGAGALYLVLRRRRDSGNPG